MYALRFRSAVRPWVTCGMYPQFVVITFPQMMSVRSVDLRTCQGNEGGFQISDDLPTNNSFRSSRGFPGKERQRIERDSVHPSNVSRLQECRGKYAGMISTVFGWSTRNMRTVGQSPWDDIKILGQSMGHLISNSKSGGTAPPLSFPSAALPCWCHEC